MESREAVVAVLVYDRSLLLTRRNSKLHRHAGEIGFPGGMVAEGESYEEALKRELKEEMSLSPEDYEIKSPLPPVKTLITNIKIFPFLVALDHPHKIRPNPEEVEDFAFIPIEDLKPLLQRDSVETRLGVVWGATARIIRNFLKIHHERQT